MPATQKSAKIQKNLRISPEADRLMQLMAAYESRSAADLLEDALRIYLQHRALGWRKDLGIPADAYEDGETSVTETVARLEEAIGHALVGAKIGAVAEAVAEPAESAKERLRSRRAGAVAH